MPRWIQSSDDFFTRSLGCTSAPQFANAEAAVLAATRLVDADSLPQFRNLVVVAPRLAKAVRDRAQEKMRRLDAVGRGKPITAFYSVASSSSWQREPSVGAAQATRVEELSGDEDESEGANDEAGESESESEMAKQVAVEAAEAEAEVEAEAEEEDDDEDDDDGDDDDTDDDPWNTEEDTLSSNASQISRQWSQRRVMPREDKQLAREPTLADAPPGYQVLVPREGADKRLYFTWCPIIAHRGGELLVEVKGDGMVKLRLPFIWEKSKQQDRYNWPIRPAAKSVGPTATASGAPAASSETAALEAAAVKQELSEAAVKMEVTGTVHREPESSTGTELLYRLPKRKWESEVTT